MQSSKSRLWRMFLPLTAVLLLALLWTIYWMAASGVAQGQFALEKSRLAARGLTLECNREIWGGYPFHFEFTCKSPVIGLGDRVTVKPSGLLFTALAYAPWQIVILVDGPTTVTEIGVRTETAEHQRAIAAITFDGDKNFRLSAEVPALSVSGHGAAARVMIHARPSREGVMDVAVSVEDVNILLQEMPSLSIADGELLATLLPDRSFRIERISLQQGTVRYWGTGNLSLDGLNRPAGKLDTQTNDLDGLLSLINPYLQLTEEEKAGFGAVMGLLGKEAKAPLIARDGVLYIGPFRLTKLNPLY